MNSVPKHIKECLTKIEFSDVTVKGKLRCPCGREIFHLLYPGKTITYQGKKAPCDYDTNGTSFFIIKSQCQRCKREHLLFDRDQHGWDVLVCPELRNKDDIPQPKLMKWECVKCGKQEHSIEIRFSYGTENEIYEAVNRGFMDNPADAFEWICITIECMTCGLKTERWVDYETA
jgi:hypothetical protein